MLKNFIKNLKYLLFNKYDLKIKLLESSFLLPSYAKKGDACMDIKSSQDITIKAKETIAIPLGFAVELDEGFELQIRNRSGLAKKGLIIPNGIGTIDSGYRGEVHMMLYNSTSKPFTINKFDRIGQMVVNRVPKMNLCKVQTLSESERGTNGFGSTGI